MTKDERLKDYLEYKVLIDKNKTDDRNSQEINRDILQMIESNFNGILSGFLFSRFEQNVRKEVNRRKEPYSFFVHDEEIIKALGDPALITKTKDKIQEKIHELNVTSLNLHKDSIGLGFVFKEDILFETYTNTRRTYFFYYDFEDTGIYNGLKHIYREELLPALSSLYFRSNVNRQINPERLQICSEDNFDEEHALQEIAFNNIGKLVDRFIDSVREGRKIIIDEEIKMCFKVKSVQSGLNLSTSHSMASSKVELTAKGAAPLIHQAEEVVRKTALELLKNSVKQEDYIGFFTQSDYISWIGKKHPKVPLERIVDIFKSVTTPKAPAGVTRFTVSATDDHKELIYFIALEHIPRIFENLNKKKFDVSSHISQRHFLLFVKKLIKSYKAVDYSNTKIASLLNCSEQMIESMIKAAAKAL